MYELQEIPLFLNLSDEFLKEIKDSVLIRHHKKESIVFYEGDKSDYLHILLSGTVKVYKTTHKGTQVQINRFSAPSLLGEFAYFEKEAFPATCEFIKDGTIGLLHFDKLYLCLKNPNFSLELIKSLSRKVSVLSALVHKETILSSEAKVADLILRKPSSFLKLKNNEIASILNLTPETFSRILTKLKKEKVIQFDEHKIEVLNADALYQIVEGNSIKECTHCIDEFKKLLEQKIP
jgi:CRP/FNR family transcriptional regulator